MKNEPFFSMNDFKIQKTTDQDNHQTSWYFRETWKQIKDFLKTYAAKVSFEITYCDNKNNDIITTINKNNDNNKRKNC